MRLQGTPSTAPARDAERHLRMLGAFAPRFGLFDVRYRVRGGGLARSFLAVDAADAASTIVRIGQGTDVYVGCAVRIRRRGRREDIAPTALLWADCDGPEAFAALLAFTPAASAIVASGGEHCAHAYWALTRPLGVDELERCNRRLAAALGADARCADAARVLRVPGPVTSRRSRLAPSNCSGIRTPAIGRRRSSARCPPCRHRRRGACSGARAAGLTRTRC